MKHIRDHGLKLDILNSVPKHPEYPESVHVWIAVKAGDAEYAHARKLGTKVMDALRSARRVQADVLRIAGSDERAAVHLPARMIGRVD